MSIGESLINKWHMEWLSQSDYRSRAMNVDANMRYHLAELIDKALNEQTKEIKEEIKFANFHINKIVKQLDELSKSDFIKEPSINIRKKLIKIVNTSTSRKEALE